jgi:hypothetical protein
MSTRNIHPSEKLLILAVLVIISSVLMGCTNAPMMKGNMGAPMPQYLYCCGEGGVIFNESIPDNNTCCLFAKDPDSCNECMSSKYKSSSYRGTSSFEVLIPITILMMILLLVSVLLLIADKITSLLRTLKKGFLRYWLKVTLKIVVIISALFLGIVILFVI